MSDNGDTESVQTRYQYTNDAAALVIVIASFALLGAGATGYASLASLPQVVVVGLWIPTMIIAVAWLFGGGAVKAASQLTGGGA